MSSQLLLLLKFSLLALLYLFLLRVVRAVWAELSSPAPTDTFAPLPAAPAAPAGVTAPPVGVPAGGDAPARGRGVPRSTPPTGAVAAVGSPGAAMPPMAAATRGSTSGPVSAPGRLVVVSPPSLAGWSAEVGPGGVLVGRGPGCDLVVEDSYVSQRHLRITDAGGDTWWVEDLGSTNGTFIGGERVVAPRLVRRGEPVAIGGVVVEVR